MMTNKQFLEAVERHLMTPAGKFPLTPASLLQAYQDRPERVVEEIIAAGIERRAEQERERRERNGEGARA